MGRKKIDGIEMFDWHVGEDIRNYISGNTEIKSWQVGKTLSLSPSGFTNKLAKPYFGTIYDLMIVSKFLKKDFISKAVTILENNGILPEKLYSEKEYKTLQLELELERKDKERYIFMIEELRSMRSK